MHCLVDDTTLISPYRSRSIYLTLRMETAGLPELLKVTDYCDFWDQRIKMRCGFSWLNCSCSTCGTANVEFCNFGIR